MIYVVGGTRLRARIKFTQSRAANVAVRLTTSSSAIGLYVDVPPRHEVITIAHEQTSAIAASLAQRMPAEGQPCSSLPGASFCVRTFRQHKGKQWAARCWQSAGGDCLRLAHRAEGARP